MSSVPTPVVRGLYVCDRVERNLVNRNLTLHNCFRAIRMPIPGMPRPFYVVAHLADGTGEVECRVAISRPDTLGIVFDQTELISFSDPLEEHSVVWKITCSLVVEGRYDIFMQLKGELAALSPLAVKASEGGVS
jgi:hypothetical protein